MTTSSKSGAVCKTCSKPGFKDKAGKMQHERRGNPADYGGRRADPKAAGKGAGGSGGGGSEKEREPDREHILSRRIGGKREE